MVPAVSMLGSMLAGQWLFREKLGPSRWVGAATMVFGLCLLLHERGGPRASGIWFGDLLFVVAGLLWTIYTTLLKRWSVELLIAVSAVNVISGVAFSFFYQPWATGRWPDVGWFALAENAALQGLVAAFFVVFAYSQCVRRSGASRAALVQALIPPVALALEAAWTGALPTTLQVVAIAVSLTGLTGAAGFWARSV